MNMRLAILRNAFISVGALLGMLSFAANPPNEMTRSVADSLGDSSLVRKHPSSLSGFAAAAAASMPLAPTSTAKWAIENSPNGVGTNELFGVTCTSASDCWAVGLYLGGLPLTEHWDGTSWSVVPAAYNSAISPFNGVTCASASDCWAVGYEEVTPNSNAQSTLIEHWDGTSWSIVTSLNSGTLVNILNGVTCASALDCWAVGDSSSGTQTLIEQWDGTSWSIITSPSPGAAGNVLNSVTCASASDCWAVGDQSSCGGCAQTLIEQWDGTSWSIVPSPNTGVADLLYGVTCASASDCWAVGVYTSGASLLPLTLIEQWNGTSWSIVSSPNYPPLGTTFS